MNDSAKSSEKSRGPICPLFAECEEPIYADDIFKIRICRSGLKDAVNKSGKVPLRKEDYYIDGDQKKLFVINPYATTEEDLQEQFGGGEFWIDAMRKPDGRVLPGGHRLIFDGPEKRDGVEVAPEEDEDEEDDKTSSSKSAFPKEMLQLFDRTLTMQTTGSQERERLLREASDRQAQMQSTFASTMLQIAKDGKDDKPEADAIVRMLQSEVDEIRKKAARDEDDLRRQHRTDIERRDREIEDLRREQHAQLSKRDQEVDESRKRASTEEDEIRRRWREDVSDLRSKYERELSQARTETTELRIKLQGENDRVKTDLEKRIYELEKDNIKLEKDLAIERAEKRAAETAQETAEEALQTASRAVGSKGDSPWWLPIIQTEAGQKMLGGLVGNFMQSSAQGQSMGQAPTADPHGSIYTGPPQVFYPPSPGPMPPYDPATMPQTMPMPISESTPFSAPISIPLPVPTTPPPPPAAPSSVNQEGQDAEGKPIFIMPKPPEPQPPTNAVSAS